MKSHIQREGRLFLRAVSVGFRRAVARVSAERATLLFASAACCAAAFLLPASLARAQEGENAQVQKLWQLYQQQRYSEVAQRGRALLRERPDNTLAHLAVGRALVDDGRFPKGLTHLEQAARLDTPATWRSAWAHNYIGKAAFALGQVERSRAALERSVGLRATRNATRSSKRWLSAFGFTATYESWARLQTEHFVFRFSPNLPDGSSSARERFARRREEALRRIATFLESEPLKKRIRFFVWNSGREAKAAGLPRAGFARPAYNLVHARAGQTVGHEITHVVLYRGLDPIRRTSLINEGVAVYLDQTKRDRAAEARAALADYSGRDGLSISNLWQRERQLPARVFYPIAGAFAAHLLEHGGKAEYLRLLRRQTLADAREIYGAERLSELIASFEDDIQL